MPTMDQYAAHFADEAARLRRLGARMREAIDGMEGAMYGCDALIDLKETWEDEKARDDLLLSPRLRWGELKRIFAALDEMNAIVNDDEFSPKSFQQKSVPVVHKTQEP